MKKIFIYIVCMVFVLLIFNLVSAEKVTGSFTITGEAVEEGNDSYQKSQIEEEQESGFFTVIKNFFKRIFSFFKND